LPFYLEIIISQSLKQEEAFPIALAKQGHRFNAKVIPDIASTGYYP